MSDNTDDGIYARDARTQPVLAWVGVGVFFLGAALLTVAVVSLAADKHLSLLAGAGGGVVTIVGLALILIRGDLSGRG